MNLPPQPPSDPRHTAEAVPFDAMAWQRLRMQMEELHVHLQYIKLMLKLGVGPGPRP